jgi:peroxiredoxin
MKNKHVNKLSIGILLLGVLLFGLGPAGGAKTAGVRADIQTGAERKPAAALHLADESGKTVTLAQHQGKIVLLNFWATECGGCKLEIPWFMELDQAYKSKGLDVVGVSMDILYEDLKDAKEGWSRVAPFVRERKLKYSILMADNSAAKAYNIEAMPATYLIDRHGRIAATYIGVVDKGNVEANIKVLLRER